MLKSRLEKSRKADISFHKNGKIDITARVVHLLSIQDGDVIDVGVENSECFLYVRHKGRNCMGRHEAQCSPTKRNSYNFRAYSVRLCRAMMNFAECSDTDKTLHLACGEKIEKGNQNYLTLIFRNKL